MKILNLTITLIIASMLTFSCNSTKEKSKGQASKEINLDEIIAAADAVSSDIASIDDVFSTLELTEAKYFPMLCNDPYSASNYLNNKSTAGANLGVYVTDIVYHMYGEATEAMFLTFSASQELAKYMGLEDEFAATLLTELEGGNISKDSLILVFNGLMAESESYNSGKEMLHVHTAFLTGLYIEKLFITSSLLDQQQKTEAPTEKEIENFKKLLLVFNKQLESLDVLLPSVENQHKQLKAIFNTAELELLKTSAIALKSETNSVLNASGVSHSDKITEINKLISSIRTRIVSAS